MSDFDKEAEREKLREKFAEEEEDRQTTQQMSELLLQGATMTNQHCDTCGSPVFRHEGQAFCPTCQGEGETEGQAAGGQGPQGQAAQGQAAGGQGPQGQAAQRQEGAVERGRDGAVDGQQAGPDRESPADSQPPGRSPEVAGRTTAHGGETPDRRQGEAAGRPNGPAPDPAGERTRPAGRGDSVAALEQTLARFAQQAAETDDPRRARECLAAVREAAEALDALRR